MTIKDMVLSFNCLKLCHFKPLPPACGALSKELHEAALDHQPEHPRQVEEDGQAKQVERHPLITSS